MSGSERYSNGLRKFYLGFTRRRHHLSWSWMPYCPWPHEKCCPGLVGSMVKRLVDLTVYSVQVYRIWTENEIIQCRNRYVCHFWTNFSQLSLDMARLTLLRSSANEICLTAQRPFLAILYAPFASASTGSGESGVLYSRLS